ncbi:hypothetical protein VP01_2015g1, partial [Puccinia sorghi]
MTTTLQGCCAPTIPTGIWKTGIHGSEEGLFQWTVRPSPQQLYNDFITQAKKKYLTENSLKQAIKFIPTHPFCLTMKKKIVGLFEFIPFSSMTHDELNDMDFLAEFFHDHKSFVNCVSNFNSACLGGKMNMLGWQKCRKKDERVGLYLSLANNTFQKNHNIMVEHQMPDFGDPKLHTSKGAIFQLLYWYPIRTMASTTPPQVQTRCFRVCL